MTVQNIVLYNRHSGRPIILYNNTYCNVMVVFSQNPKVSTHKSFFSTWHLWHLIGVKNDRPPSVRGFANH